MYRVIWLFSSIFFIYKWGIIIIWLIILFFSFVYVDIVMSGGLRRVGYVGFIWSLVEEVKFYVWVVLYVLIFNFNVIFISLKWVISIIIWN